MSANSDYKYEIIIYWSNEDDVFVAEVPELPRCMTHGHTLDEALSNAKEAMALWIKMAERVGNAVPEPKEARLMFA